MESEGRDGGGGDSVGYTSTWGESSKKASAQRPQNWKTYEDHCVQ